MMAVANLKGEPVRKVGLVIILIAIIFTLHHPQSRSITVLDIERVGDRLLSSDEQAEILASAEALPLATDIVYQGRSFGVKTRGHSYVVTDDRGDIYYTSSEPIRLLAGLNKEWLIARQQADLQQVIAYDPQLDQERLIAELYGAEIGDAVIWNDGVYFESRSSYKGEVIYRYLPGQSQLNVFIENGFEPKVYAGRLHYLYRKGEAIGFESISADGTDVLSFIPSQTSIYSYLFRDGEIDLMSIAKDERGWYFLRIQDAFERADVEKFEMFDARFQSDRLVFGTNGIRDSLLIDNTLVQIPKEMHFRVMIGPDVYFVSQDQHYRIPVSLLESILSNQ